eukprot:maker-scaffold_29-snap-gene-4.4-mRNA-1 protein AED:0.00 eAED:0.00 QI:197/1/1/1/0.75/0.8/5/660/519
MMQHQIDKNKEIIMIPEREEPQEEENKYDVVDSGSGESYVHKVSNPTTPSTAPLRVYTQRWFVLAAFCLNYFIWNLHTLRIVPLVPEFAKYFDTTNEFNPPDELGIDFLTILESASLVLLYPLAGHLSDKFGLQLMKLSAVLQTGATWGWYLSFDNFFLVILFKILASFAGVLNATGFLRLSSHWFPKSERTIAVALGVIFSELGAGASLIFGPLFATGEPFIDIELKSCKKSFIESYNASLGDFQECSEEALDKFCCIAPTDIDGLNFTLAIMASVVCIYTLLSVDDSPLTPPSKSGHVKPSPGLKRGLAMMFQHKNYLYICIADFILSGPPQTLFAALSRLVPISVEDEVFIASAIGLSLAIIGAGFFAKKLTKTQRYYEYTSFFYTYGSVSWFLATLFTALGGPLADYLFLLVIVFALVALVVWTVTVYELKIEYVYSSEFSLEGLIVGIDRMIINLSGLIFLASIPPERLPDEKAISGRLFTFLAGSGAMLVGLFFVFALPDKRKYRRILHEDGN